MENFQNNINPSYRYTTKEACNILSISRRTLERRVNGGYIRKHLYKSNLRPFFLGIDLIAMINATL